jgi:hypothetical protein
MDKTLKKVVITGVVIVSLSAVYYFAVRPTIQAQKLDECMQRLSGDREAQDFYCYKRYGR